MRLNPKSMSLSDLARIALRNPTAPMGAVSLPRVEIAQWEAPCKR